MKNLTLRQLQVFDAVATTLSYSAAADALGITQPAVSMLMRQLEADAGVALLLRQGRRMDLTHAGAMLLRHARSILEQVRIAEDTLASIKGGTGGHLHLGVVSTANYFAPRLLTEFQRRMPGVSFKLTVARRDDLLAMLQNHRIDVAIAGHPPGEAEVEAETFARHPHCIVAPADHPLARRRRVRWADLARAPFIFREPGSATRQFLEHLLASQSLRVKVGIELDGNETVKQAVMAGMGITFMSAHAFQVELQAGLIAILDLEGMPKHLDWCLLHRRDTVLAGVSAAFREFVIEAGAGLIACRTASSAA